MHDAALLVEIKQIKKAFKNAKKIQSGKLKGRPVEELLAKIGCWKFSRNET